MNELQKVGEVSHCPKCLYQFIEGTVDARPHGHCPRCAYDLTIIDITDTLATDEQLKKMAGMRELCDLMQMLRNWSTAYQRWVGENGVDWSSPHEFLEEYGMQMAPYVARLLQTGYIDKESVLQLGSYFRHEMDKLIVVIEAEEDLMRLTGRWGDDEQEIKEYWMARTGTAIGCSTAAKVELPMRDDKRESSD